MLILLLLTCLLLVIVGFSCVIIEEEFILEGPTSSGYRGRTSGFLSQVLVDLNSESSEETSIFAAKVQEKREINEDVVGWIAIEDFGIDYPVLYSEDNKAYLRHNIYKEYDIAGCIYLDANYGNIYSPMKLIHGHNMRNGTMFGELPQMLHWDSLDDAPLIQYYDDLGLKAFKIFAVYSVNAEEESVIISEYSTLQELQELKNYYCDRSWTPVSEIPKGLEMLMLNTCWYGESGTEHKLHCIVVACRV